MVRMSSCRGNEFTPVFGAYASSESEDSDDEDGDDGVAGPASPGSEHSGSGGEPDEMLEDVDGAFADARDRWKINAETLKGFFLSSATGQLYGWDQARGVLYEYERQSGSCVTIWAACAPQVNAEIWTVLPLPPTDPASLQNVQTTQSGRVLCILHASRTQAQIRAASMGFCTRLGLEKRALAALERLPLAGQAYVVRTFFPPERDPTGALCRQVGSLLRLGENVPWAGLAETVTLRVPASGSILGRCVPELAALCWDDTDAVTPAHCRIACIQGTFSVCDLGAAEDGTLFDGRKVGTDWVPLKDGCLLALGPVQIRVELAPVKATLDGNLPPMISIATSSGVDAPPPPKRRPPVQRGGWRNAKRARSGGAGADVDTDTESGPPPLPEPAESASSRQTAAQGSTQVDWRHTGQELPAASSLSSMAKPPLAASSSSFAARGLGKSHISLQHLMDEEDDWEPWSASPAEAEASIFAPRADCPAAPGAASGKTGLAFWAVREPSPTPCWVPRTPPQSPPSEESPPRRRHGVQRGSARRRRIA